MSARTGTSPALRRCGSVVTPAKSKAYRRAFWGWVRLVRLARIRAFPGGNLDGNGCIKFFYYFWQAAAAGRSTGKKLPGSLFV